MQVGLADAGGPPRRRLLPRHAPAPGAGHRAARRPRRPGAGRAGQRPGPRGHPVAARLPAPPRPRRRAARCSSPATCSRRWSRPSTGWSSSAPAGWSARARWSSCARVPTAPARCSSAAPRPPGWPRCCAPTARGVTAEDGTLTRHRRRRRPRSGRRAFAAGIELHELRSRTSGLEEIYFQLTAGSGAVRRSVPGRSRRPGGLPMIRLVRARVDQAVHHQGLDRPAARRLRDGRRLRRAADRVRRQRRAAGIPPVGDAAVRAAGARPGHRRQRAVPDPRDHRDDPGVPAPHGDADVPRPRRAAGRWSSAKLLAYALVAVPVRAGRRWP